MFEVFYFLGKNVNMRSKKEQFPWHINSMNLKLKKKKVLSGKYVDVMKPS
jgi:hypothetical protein